MITFTSLKRLAIAIVGLSLFISAIPTYADQPVIEILEYRWTNQVGNAIDSNKPIPPFFENRYGQYPRHPPLYLWMKVRANEAAFEQLKESGNLTLRHKWFRRIGTKVIWTRDNIPLTIGRLEMTDLLQDIVQNHGYFDWRTHSVKNNIQRGGWEVIVQADNAKLKCDPNKSKITTKCRFFIRVK